MGSLRQSTQLWGDDPEWAHPSILNARNATRIPYIVWVCLFLRALFGVAAKGKPKENNPVSGYPCFVTMVAGNRSFLALNQQRVNP